MIHEIILFHSVTFTNHLAACKVNQILIIVFETYDHENSVYGVNVTSIVTSCNIRRTQ